MSEGLPPKLQRKRPVYEISSDEDENEDNVTISDPSPLRSKRPRMTAANKSTSPRHSALDKLRAAAGINTSPSLTQPSAIRPKTHKRGAPAKETFWRLPHLPADSGDSSHTELRTDTVNQPPINSTPASATSNDGDQGTVGNESTTNPEATADIRSLFDPIPRVFDPPASRTNPGRISLIAAPNILTHTTLRIYIPSSTNKVYVPLRLSSVPTLSPLFAAMGKIVEPAHRNASILMMHFDSKAARNRDLLDENSRGIMAVKKGVDSSWECLLEEVRKRVGGILGEAEIGVGIEVGVK